MAKSTTGPGCMTPPTPSLPPAPLRRMPLSHSRNEGPPSRLVGLWKNRLGNDISDVHCTGPEKGAMERPFIGSSERDDSGPRGCLQRRDGMRAVTRAAVAAIALLQIHPASASELTDMLGKWTWQRFTIEVHECARKRLCSKVIAGPKNVGMEIFASDLTRKNGDWYGLIIDPETGATYNTRLRYTGAKSWRLDGCITSRVCLSGEFVRAK